ncbi:hypothetical protein DSO57_1029315 [Entomophthora muscae]|uniref:Uncharacterized protein n=1 Tax=Entomophthora muscae TaxID=34485 RepID=A0ACC2TN14_9FUNG|nr:hypothetical protein DSO57_1029315 [Entomophthora muscae]
MKESQFLFWFLVLCFPVVLALDNPAPTTDWHNFSPDDSYQKEYLANGWFKYPSSHWGRNFQYSWSTTLPPPAEPSLVRPNASFYLLPYLVGHYLLDLPPCLSHSNTMQETPTITLAQEANSTQDSNKLGFVYITVLGLANQVVTHTRTWCPWATAA